MRRSLLVAVGALALTGNASAAYTPRLVVDPAPAGGGFAISLDQPTTDQSTAGVTILAPRGYRVPLDRTPGAPLGTATATGIVRTAGSAPFRLTGRITSAAPAAYAANTCAPGLHRQVWVVTLSGAGQSVTAPIYVDPQGAGALKLRLCPGSPDAQPAPGVPVSPGLARLELRFAPGTWTSPVGAGEHVWRALLTPYEPRSADSDPAATVESRAIVRRPQLTLLGKLGGRGKVVLYGRLLAGADALAKATVTLLAGPTAGSQKAVSSSRTNAAGRYAFALRLKRTTFYRTRVVSPARDVPCRGPSSAPGGCISATLQPFDVLSTTSVKVSVRG